MQVRLDAFFDWARDIGIDPSAFAYFVDAKGNAAGHPRFSPQGAIENLSFVPVVRKALRGGRGVEESYDPIEKEDLVAAYEPVPAYGWGVIVAQPSRTVFAVRDAALRNIVLVYDFIFILAGLFAFAVLRLLSTINGYRQEEKIVLDSIGDGIAAIDRNWIVTHWNKAAAAITGWYGAEALGRPVRNVLKFIRERDRTENTAFIEHAVVTGQVGMMEGDTVLVRKDGREIPVGDSASPVFGDGGQVKGAIVIFRDTSKERETRMLRSDFAYASHQLRTPVNKANWAIEAALEAGDLAEAKEVLRGAVQSMKSLVKTSDELVAVSEADQGMVMPKIAPAKLVEIIESAVAAVADEAKKRNVVIAVEPVSAIASVETDGKLLSGSLEEILENAVRYGRDGGEIRVRVRQNDSVVIEVRDGGIGIPERDQPLVFHKFFRGGNFDTTAVPGAGLGLYLASEYVKLLKGKIWFVSKEKQGTTFYVSIPAAYPSGG